MSSIHPRRTPRTLLGLVALVLAGLVFAAATNVAGAADAPDRANASKDASERLVVRGEATVGEVPCDGDLCIALTDGQFRGTPVGTGAYTGAVTLKLADAFPNGEGGGCAPMKGTIMLGGGTPDQLVLAITGDSCQDGAGDLTTSSFTGLARFTVKHGTGQYAGARGSGLASFLEDAADHDRMTLIGHING
jgi:hypothetical protein